MLTREKQKGIRAFALFFAGMGVFTLLSRAIYQQGTAVVQVSKPTRGTIAHSLSISGKTIHNRELAVSTVAGLTVAEIAVTPGQQVKQGQLLFALDLTQLEETILLQEEELKKQQLSIQDAWSQGAVAQKQQANQKAQAQESYDSTVGQAQRLADRAKARLDQAEKDLADFLAGKDVAQTQQEALKTQVETARQAYDQARQALANLEQEVEQAAAAAIAQAEEAQQTQPTQPTQPSQPMVPETQPGAELPGGPAPAEPSQPPTQESTQVSDQPPAASEPGLPEPTADLLSLVVPLALTQPEKDAIAARVRGEYAPALEQARKAVTQAKTELEQAQQALAAFGQQAGTPVTEQSLRQEVEQARQEYEDAQAALESAKVAGARAIASASLPLYTGNAAQIGQITYQQMARQLEKLRQLAQAGGQILAPTDGTVLQCTLETGAQTTQGPAVLLADTSQGCRFSGLVSQEQSKYIGTGDLVTLKNQTTGKSYRELPVESLSTLPEPEGGYRLTVQLPPDTLALGANVELSFTQKSQPYCCCVPLAALRLDAQNKPYVLVVETGASVMGQQLQARKVPVTVLEQNETTAALAEGPLGAEDEIIVAWDKPVDAGSRVRVG